MDAKIRVAVIGVGYLGEHHARIYSEMEGVELVGVVDVRAERAQEISQKYGCRSYSDLADLLGKVDAASVTVPTPLHHSVSMRLLGAGADVLLEKPMTKSLAEADELIATARREGRLLQVGHVERFNPATQKLLSLSTGEVRFIEAHRIGPFVERGTDVHVILDLMIHDIDIILTLIPSEVTEIRAVGVPVLSGNLDIASARLAFANGAVANVTASRVSRERLRKLRVFQPEMYLSLDFQTQELVVAKRVFELTGENPPRPEIKLERMVLEKGEPLKEELSGFIESVRTRQIPRVRGEEGRRA
ncbi:MAG TPA: Gfo/Idh/MocA family oxidoreductase, partial [Nitrospiria bacterium]|nr:Gfo/Idh/MocA family oxidoreductase [Nitrospiria bacterium]